MAKAKTLYISNSNNSNGVDITWTKSRQTLYISGWYDSFVGIQGEEFTLKDFFEKLGITEKDCIKAFKDNPLQ